MKIIAKQTGGELILQFEGELDHHAAKSAIRETANLIDSELPMYVVLDFGGITFMDSSGIALIIGAFKKIDAFGGQFSVINASKQVYKVLNAAGITQLVNISQKDNSFISK